MSFYCCHHLSNDSNLLTSTTSPIPSPPSTSTSPTIDSYSSDYSVLESLFAVAATHLVSSGRLVFWWPESTNLGVLCLL